MLKFSPGSANAKLRKLEAKIGKKVYSFSIRSGHNCPSAKECSSKAVEVGQGKREIVDGPHTKFRCFSASQEVLWSGVYNQRKDNEIILTEAARNYAEAGTSLSLAIPQKAEVIRVHIGGDFKTYNYLKAWLFCAAINPSKRFYAYTKQIKLWLKAKAEDCIPDNFELTASFGGYNDNLILPNKLKSAIVVNSEYQARKMGLVVDHDDSHALKAGKSFALVVHGTQPAGTVAAKAWARIKKNGD